MVVEKLNIESILFEIFSGFSFRSKVEHDPTGDLLVIQMKDLEDNYTSISQLLTKINSKNISPRFCLKKGDVLFIAKGSNNYALEFNLDLPNVVAASAFFILRPNLSRVSSAYLAWYINQTPVQQYLKENTAGTYIPNINKSAIQGITVALPTLEVQKKIVALDRLRHRESMLMDQIRQKRAVAISAALLDIVNN